MRKKKLIEQNRVLFEALQESKRNTAELSEQLNENAAIISKLEKELSELKEKGAQNPQENEKPAETEEKIQKPETENSFDANSYGAKAIGNMVLKASEYCTKLGTDLKNKEQINLILGRTEVAKSDILAVVTGKDDSETQKEKIDDIKKVTIDYFESIMAQ